MFERANQAIINFIQDAQPLIITLLALSLLAAGLTMMFGDTGRRWAKQTILCRCSYRRRRFSIRSCFSKSN